MSRYDRFLGLTGTTWVVVLALYALSIISTLIVLPEIWPRGQLLASLSALLGPSIVSVAAGHFGQRGWIGRSEVSGVLIGYAGSWIGIAIWFQFG